MGILVRYIMLKNHQTRHLSQNKSLYLHKNQLKLVLVKNKRTSKWLAEEFEESHRLENKIIQLGSLSFNTGKE